MYWYCSNDISLCITAIRMSEATTIAYLVVANIHGQDVEVDFHSILPGLPDTGEVVIATSLGDSEPETEIG